MMLGHRADQIDTQAEVGSIGSAVRKAAAPGAGSIEPVVLALAVETAGMTTEDMGSVTAGRVAAEEVCYTPTALEDMVMMFRNGLGQALVHMSTLRTSLGQALVHMSTLHKSSVQALVHRKN
jgi:hypothetical protein